MFRLKPDSGHPLRVLLTLVLFSAACLGLGLVSLYFSAGDYGLNLFRWYLTQPKVLVLNLLPFWLLGLLLLALLDRAWLAFALDAAVCLFFSWAQYWKLMARSDPIYAEDLLIFSEAAQMAGQYITVTWQIVLSGVLAVLGTGVLCFFRGRLRRPLPRIALAAAVIALAAWLCPSYYTSQQFYNTMSVWPELNPWIDTNRYISRGGIYPFLYSVPDALPTPPEGYDADAAEAILAAYPSADIPREQQVSIVLTQLEAFCDLSQVTDQITGVDPYAEYHALQAESFHGRLLPNVFAGGTIDTERCVLTGFSALESFRRPSWSYARYFESQGYTVEGAHAGYEAFYNRLNVNANLGIPDYRFIENHYSDFMNGIPKDPVFLPDVTEHVLTALEQGPVFSFNVTYQNHGPYSAANPHFSEACVPQGGLSDGDYHIVNNYLWGVRDTCLRMQEMVDAFRDIEEPVILVFFGDHKPWLGDQSITYDALGIDIRSQGEESFYNYYATDYLIWANDAAKTVLGTDFIGTGPDISPCFLMNVLFDQCGWSGPGYTSLTDEVMAATPLLHSSGRRLHDGALTEVLPEDLQLLVDKMACVQYYLAMDSDGEHP
ncbi:MAG: LTA synthase family protein [Oscillospiraceae bacterium]|nr:LTA synthase family protein [Oscillospiraceae bacterium]